MKERKNLFPGKQLWYFLMVIMIFPGISAGVYGKGQDQKTAGTAFQPMQFDERIACQRDIERVYWEHRAWPKENQATKPSFENAVSEAIIKSKTEDTLKKSHALESFWGTMVTGYQLQAEMDRMARESKQPDVLKELWAALGNDPHKIAECLVRPAYINTYLRALYAFEDKIHGALKERILNELDGKTSIDEIKNLDGTYRELYSENKKNNPHEIAEGSKRDPSALEWDRMMMLLRKAFPGRQSANRHGVEEESIIQHIKPGMISSLQEDEYGIYVVAVLENSNLTAKIATIQWPKTTFDAWWQEAQAFYSPEITEPAFTYHLPKITASSCSPDTWNPTFQNHDYREYHSAVWTGEEMIIWGGIDVSNGENLNAGLRYNPTLDTWRAMSNVNAPSARTRHTAIWTGTEMIIWGGCASGYGCTPALNTGGRYNPLTDSWAATSITNAPDPRYLHTAVWTGNQMIIWGGTADEYYGKNTGGRYNPVTDTWTPTSLIGAPSARWGHTAVWANTYGMIVWGGRYQADDLWYLKTGAIYKPASDRWVPVTMNNAPGARGFHFAVWTGTYMIIWGGLSCFDSCYPGPGAVWEEEGNNTGSRYNPSTNIWHATTMVNAPLGGGGTAVWSGTELLRYGGIGYSSGRYNPTTNQWKSMSALNFPYKEGGYSAVWTGHEMVIWGGSYSYDLAGNRYNPQTDTWTKTSIAGVRGYSPIIYYHVAIWTGNEMIIWGVSPYWGLKAGQGARYNLATDSWTQTSDINAPEMRQYQTAVWTGTDMLIWGGLQGAYEGNYLNTGGKYNPLNDSWTATSIINAPDGRAGHSAVWTGTEMIIWGGYYYDGNYYIYLDTGGRYNPGTNSWIATSTIGQPLARELHTAIWTGTEMIIWGGEPFYTGGSGSGGIFNPVLNTWRPTSLIGAPDIRTHHSAVWTGNEMIVWGGTSIDNTPMEDGGRYNPVTDTWIATGNQGTIEGRSGHTAVWIGQDMIVWGGCAGLYCQNMSLKMGRIYNPISDSWRSTSELNAPEGRYEHSALWTGEQMIIWGGFWELTDGGIYCPAFPDFSVPCTVTSFDVTQGSNASIDCSATSLLNFVGSVTMNCDNMPGGAQCTFSQNPIPLPANGTVTFQVTVAVQSNTPAGAYAMNLHGTNSSTDHVFPVTMNVITSSGFKIIGIRIDQHSTTGTNSNLNGILEPGETVMVEPLWQNMNPTATAVTALASNWIGPSGAQYTILNGTIDYGSLAPGAITDCMNSDGDCYVLSVSDPASRPAMHWDASFDESLDVGGTRTWSVHIGKSFSDTDPLNSFYPYIEAIFHAGITSGCGGTQYCPNLVISREQMAKFMCQAIEKTIPNYCSSSSCQGIFLDVPITNIFCPYIEDLFSAGILSGCQSLPLRFCASQSIQRQAMAKIVCNSMDAAHPHSCITGGQPDACQGIFGDVSSANPFCAYIEALFNAGVVSGCASNLYCPTATVTRQQMAKFLVNAFLL